jgi:hypothetical protein
MKSVERFLIMLVIAGMLPLPDTYVSAQNPVCVYCGVPLPNGVHHKGCPYYVAPNTSSQSSGGASQNSPKNLTEFLIQGAVNFLLNPNTTTSTRELYDQKKAEEARAMEAAEAKRIREEAERAEHKKLMDDYKPLGNPEVKYKSLDESGNFTPVHFNCKVTTYRGNVQIRKANGETIHLTEHGNFDLAVGDVISTGSDGIIKVHFALEKGGEDVLIGRNTSVKIMQSPEGIQYPKLFNGQLHASNLTLKEAIDQKVEELDARLDGLKKKIKKKFEVSTPSAVTSTRGTDFTVSENPMTGTGVTVMEGSVELKGYGSEEFIVVEAGYKGSVTPEGVISGPDKVDLNGLEKWWEEEKEE